MVAFLRGSPVSGCEHRESGSGRPSCRNRAVFLVSRDRKADAQKSCRLHLGATVEALMQADDVPVTVTRLHEQGSSH